MSDDVIQLTSKNVFIIGKFRFDYFKASIFRLEKPMGGVHLTPPPPLDVPRTDVALHEVMCAVATVGLFLPV